MLDLYIILYTKVLEFAHISWVEGVMDGDAHPTAAFVPLSCILRTSIIRTSDLQAAAPLLPVPDRTYCRSEKNLSRPDF